MATEIITAFHLQNNSGPGLARSAVIALGGGAKRICGNGELTFALNARKPGEGLFEAYTQRIKQLVDDDQLKATLTNENNRLYIAAVMVRIAWVLEGLASDRLPGPTLPNATPNFIVTDIKENPATEAAVAVAAVAASVGITATPAKPAVLAQPAKLVLVFHDASKDIPESFKRSQLEECPLGKLTPKEIDPTQDQLLAKQQQGASCGGDGVDTDICVRGKLTEFLTASVKAAGFAPETPQLAMAINDGVVYYAAALESLAVCSVNDRPASLSPRAGNPLRVSSFGPFAQCKWGATSQTLANALVISKLPWGAYGSTVAISQFQSIVAQYFDDVSRLILLKYPNAADVANDNIPMDFTSALRQDLVDATWEYKFTNLNSYISLNGLNSTQAAVADGTTGTTTTTPSGRNYAADGKNFSTSDVDTGALLKALSIHHSANGAQRISNVLTALGNVMIFGDSDKIRDAIQSDLKGSIAKLGVSSQFIKSEDFVRAWNAKLAALAPSAAATTAATNAATAAATAKTKTDAAIKAAKEAFEKKKIEAANDAKNAKIGFDAAVTNAKSA